MLHMTHGGRTGTQAKPKHGLVPPFYVSDTRGRKTESGGSLVFGKAGMKMVKMDASLRV